MARKKPTIKDTQRNVLILLGTSAIVGTLLTPEARLFGALIGPIGLGLLLFWWTQLLHALMNKRILWSLFLFISGWMPLLPAIYALTQSNAFLPGITKK